jgi:hypothetical protein
VFDAGRYLSIASLTAAGLIGARTAWACHRARRHGLPGADAAVWATLAVVFLLFSQTRLARVMGWLKGGGQLLRSIARDHGLYAGRRPFQIAATVAVALVVLVLLAIGIAWMWHYIKRYRLAIGFAALTVGFGLIRFISLHEVDAWNAALPWLKVVVDVAAALGASAVALTRLRQLRADTGTLAEGT